MPEMPDVIVLCGGAGTRLRSVTGNTPKSMVDIAGRPFLELLLRQLQRYGFQRAILAVSRQTETIFEHFGICTFDLELIYSCEPVPLGTGGALGHAAHLVSSNVALVTNGDSYTNVDLSAFVANHHVVGADISLVIAPRNERVDCGTVSINEGGTVDGFWEKAQVNGSQYINAGLYLISKSLLCAIPERRQTSLEKELLPQWLKQDRLIRGFASTGECIDIGTPDRYSVAQHKLACVETTSDEGISNRSRFR